MGFDIAMKEIGMVRRVLGRRGVLVLPLLSVPLLATVLRGVPGEARRGQDPATPTAAPGARGSTPSALAAMLRRVPGDLPRSAEPDHALVFADAVGQLAALGLPAPTTGPREPTDPRALIAVAGLAWPDHLGRNGHEPA